MKCKFSLPTPIDLLRAGIGVLLLGPAAHAQQASPASSRQPASSYVRFWNMLPAKEAPTMQLLSADDKVLATAPPLNFGATYAPLAPGSYTFTVRKLNDAANALKKQPLLMRNDVYVTYLVSEKNNQPVVELIDDTLDPKKVSDPSQLVIRQCVPGARITVTTREGLASHEIGYGESTILGNLPNQVVFLAIRATGLGGDAKTWSTEADFAMYRHATLLVGTDPYGRFRPRLAYDGQTVAAMQAALKASQNAGVTPASNP